MTREHVVSLRTLSDEDDAMIDELNEREDVKRYLFAVSRHPKAPERYRLYAILADGSQAGIVGTVPSRVYDGTDVELICAVRTSYESKRVATKAGLALLNLERLAARHRRILATTSPDNDGGRALAQRLGFTATGDTRPSGEAIWEWTP